MIELTPHQWIILAHTVATGVMMGVIWTVQLVHYPLFLRVPPEAFPAYEREHMRRIGAIVGPAMIIELITAAWIAADPPAGIGAEVAWAGAALVAVNWASTALVQGPTHVRLAEGFDARRIRFLVRSNWVRTIAWSARGLIAAIMALGSARAAIAVGGTP